MYAFVLLYMLESMVQIVGYIDELLKETITLCSKGEATPQSTDSIPQPLCSGYERPEKISAIVRHNCRFSIQ